MDGDIEHLVSAITALGEIASTVRLRDVFAAVDLLEARVCAGIELVDRSGEVAADGAVSTAHWLRTYVARTDADARSLVKRAGHLRACPELAAAWADGRLSTGQVDVITAKVNDRTEALFAEHAAAVLAALVGLSVRETAVAMHHWAVHAEALIDGPAPVDNFRTLGLSPGLDGGAELAGRLDAAGFGVVDAALNAATIADIDGEPARNRNQRRADALVAISRYYLDHRDVSTTTRRRPDVQVVVTLAELEHGAGRTVDGRPVDSATVGALLCDAGIHRLVTDGASVTLDVGRSTRTVNHHLFAALALRDQGCRFPDCDRPVSWCEAHHVVPWQQGGSTRPDNLLLLCWRHHHDFAHHPEWRLKLLPDATVEVTTPSGRTLTSRPPPTEAAASTAPVFLRLFAA